ncbi:glycoside hydrolase family 32 protein [Faecalibacterium sp. An122]|uniref:glycoside hydrolase family 32 protein n=1 Tax=Faecalibacterium sp. An122 TaxID=1965551 RepID=UPI000B3ABA49|nr:glycoside hydrolase family 32 protein [Faecalibacterium sp. An122]OUQ36945.1 sucrose-6-phosphate hydrolase [Faecalibacterium sp. An122]
MISEKLQRARDFEARYGAYIPDGERPAFHVTGTVGWINDPNGFSCYQGEYHLFYQYHPYSNNWGPMHWGHVKTRDFIRWERLPAAMAPDTDADRDGCFSGSAIELADGRQMLVYTGVYETRRADGQVESFQQQCVAFGDGVNYEKYPGNPVLDGSDLPAGGSVLDFRDPKVWQDPDGTFYMVAGNRTPDGSGAIRLFESPDGTHWSYACTLDSSRNEYGRMWECPDFFPLDGQQVMLVSPQEMTAAGLEFHAGFGSIALMGRYDPAARRFARQRIQSIDYGTDFYAPQTLQSYDGRRIMIAWMQNWATTNCQPQGTRWFGQMTLPRELSLREGRLIQNPVRELENYRGHKVSYQDLLVTGETNLSGVSGRLMDLTVTVRPVDDRPSYQAFKIHLAKDGQRETLIRYKVANSTLRLDRTHSGFPYDIVNVRDFPVRPRDGAVKIRVVMDRYSLEVFVNDGEQAASMVIYTPLSAQSVSFEVVEGAAYIDVEHYSLNFGQEDAE